MLILTKKFTENNFFIKNRYYPLTINFVTGQIYWHSDEK